MNTKGTTIGIGEIGTCTTPDGRLSTLALGSCVAVILYEPRVHCIAMAHIGLPNSAVSPEKGVDRPGYFADTGIPKILEAMREAAGVQKNRFIVKLAGGATMMDASGRFNIGKRNILAIKKLLWQHGLGVLAEDVGGSISRTVVAETESGRVRISSPGKQEWTI